jgi:hypothetical protein
MGWKKLYTLNEELILKKKKTCVKQFNGEIYGEKYYISY